MSLTDKFWKRALLLMLGGVLSALTLVFPKAGFAEWITLVPVGIFLLSEADSDQRRLRSMYGWGFFFFMCYYLVVFHWFVNLYPLEFIDGVTPAAALAVVLAGCVGLSALQAFFGGFMFVTVRLLFRTRLLTQRKILRPIAVAALWAIYEWSQNIGWWGVPWGRLPIGQSGHAIGLQTASLFGSYFITAAIVAVNMCVAYALLNRPSLKAMSVTVASILLFQYGVGAALYFIPVDSEQTVRVAAIQGNVSTSEKWGAESRRRTYAVYSEYTAKAAEQGAQIVVWPETAFPYTLTPDNDVGEFCSELAARTGVTILVGAFTRGENGESYNSIVCVLPDGSFHQTVYSKIRLVPFGEFVPLKGLIQTLIPPLADLVMSTQEIDAGQGANVISLENANIGSLVCFDSIYDYLARESVREGASLLTISTNDSWFTDSAALYMHNAQAQMRAVENGRYVIRAANTGISTAISSKGEVLDSLPPLVEGMVVCDVSVNTHRTLYSLTGNLVLWLFAGALIGVFADNIVYKYRNRYEKRD